MHRTKLLGLAILVGLAAAPLLLFSCSPDNSRAHEEYLVGNLPLQEIIGRVVPASLRQGILTTSQAPITSQEQGRAVRHDEYLIQMGLLPAALPGFETRFCQELRKELEKHTALRGSGTGAAACSFHLASGNRHAWVSASQLGEKKGQYQVLVIVDEW
jgi:hypothetical protein